MSDKTLVHMPNTKLSAEVVLHRTIAKLDKIKSVMVIIQWDDETMSADWSSMPTSKLCMASQYLHGIVQRDLFENE